MGGFGASGGKSKSKSGTKFNEDFLNSYEDRYGKAPTVDQSTLPQAQSLFTPQVQQQAQGLGFGQAPDKTTAPTVGTSSVNAPTLGAAPQAQAATVQMPFGSGDQFERAAFRSQFAPVARQFDRQAAEQRGQLQSGIAGAGIGSSAAGIGLMQKQAQDQTETRTALASEAADRAATQRFGFEQQAALANQQAQQQVALANAERQQQVNLAQAGFDQQAQQVNAANILQGNLANASNYLQAVGLDASQAAQSRADFLSLLGLQQADLARLDDNARQNTLDQFNAYLQMFAQVAGASRFGNSSSFNFGVSAAAGK